MNAVSALARERGQVDYANRLRTVECKAAWNKAWQGLAEITASSK